MRDMYSIYSNACCTSSSVHFGIVTAQKQKHLVIVIALIIVTFN